MFPYVRDAPVGATSSRTSQTAVPTTGSLRSARPQWTTSTRGRKTTTESRQRVLVFVAGGATYSEVRTVYKVSEAANKDVFLGE